MMKKLLIELRLLLKMIMPIKWYSYLMRVLINSMNRKFRNLKTQEMFEYVYSQNYWGDKKTIYHPFYSGPGSHDSYIVDCYIKAVTKFIENFPNKVTALDVGCGDFNIGSKLFYKFDKYIAVDIVRPLIKFNTNKWISDNLEFKVLNVIKDDIPMVDIIFVKEVFQHLKNSEIKKIIINIQRKCKWVLITEFLPGPLDQFLHNLDRGVGPGTRRNFFSGVVLTSPPFNLQTLHSECLMQINVKNGVLRTDAYCLN